MSMRMSSLAILSVLVITSAVHAQLTDRLERGGDFSFQIIDGRYTLSVLGGSGIFRSSARRLLFLPNEGLDWQMRVRDLINEIGSDYMLRFQTTILPNGDIQWDIDAAPNECTTVRVAGYDYPFLLTRISARFTMRPTPIECQPDPHNRLDRATSIQLDSVGGDEGNYLQIEGYFPVCGESNSLFIQGAFTNLVLRGYGGGPPKSLGNVNNDCIVDDADLLQVLFHFGGSDTATDTNGDGIVDDADLLTVLFNFGIEG